MSNNSSDACLSKHCKKINLWFIEIEQIILNVDIL